MIYLDNAATTQRKPQQVIDAVVQAMTTLGNASRGAHEGALQASRTIYDTRCKVARLFGCSRADHVVFTCNATEALNIAIHGTLNPGDHVITTDMEHNSVLRPLSRLESEGSISLSFVPAADNQRLSAEDFRPLLRPDTRSATCVSMAMRFSFFMKASAAARPPLKPKETTPQVPLGIYFCAMS